MGKSNLADWEAGHIIAVHLGFAKVSLWIVRKVSNED